ncbi:RNA polymerase sigma factor [Actinoplanes sp. NPDC048988]|uniref:RNA polymerase sigma factor n=1 Tax=Actinoplanes sp. NPDC048988 TaxID=3363901 RepID=UPI00371E59DC
MSEPHHALAEIVRAEGTRIVATLARTLGDLQSAEDAMQEAAVRALREWPRTGVPESPRAWLIVTARRAAIDRIRRESARAGKERAGMELILPGDLPDTVVRDDQLRLIFTCCHPALSLPAQVTLTLRVLCGLDLPQIAAVLLTTESAVAKRLTRTRGKIARARIPYRVPSDEELPQRLAAVCAVIHASYTAAHSRLGGDTVRDPGATREAVRLARLVQAAMPDEVMPAAVLALILLTEARTPARLDEHGDPVILAEQDRTRWDRGLIAEGLRLLDRSLRRSGGVADPYQLQAAIAAEHARAADYRDTDWAEIVRLYDLLLSVRPDDAARLARAVAVAEAHGPAAGLSALDAMPRGPVTHRWQAVRAELLARDGHLTEAADGMRRALTPDVNAAERRYRERRIALWEQS